MFANIVRRQAINTERSLPRHSFRRLASTASSTSAESGASTFANTFKYLRYLSVASSIAGSAYFVGSLYPPTFATYLSPRIAPPPPDPGGAPEDAGTAAPVVEVAPAGGVPLAVAEAPEPFSAEAPGEPAPPPAAESRLAKARAAVRRRFRR